MKGGEEATPPRGLFTPLYWAAMAAGLLLTLAGGAVGWLGPHLLAAHPAHARPAPKPALTEREAHGRGAG